MKRKFIFILMSAFSALSLAEPLPLNAKIDGKTMADLSAQWWQWAMAQPADMNPVRDTQGSKCSVGQKGKVWFLAGGFGPSKISRVCTVPDNKYLFFPVINMAYWQNDSALKYTCAQAKTAAKVNNDSALDLFVEVDGVPVKNPKKYRVASSKCFNIYAGVDKKYKPYNAYPSASDGYWLLLPPLSKGQHKIKFGGRYNASVNPYGAMVQDIEYELIVE